MHFWRAFPDYPIRHRPRSERVVRYHSSVSWHAGFQAISRRFRRGRMERFAREFAITSETRILDVGGAPETWDLLPAGPCVTLLNTPRTQDEMSRAASWVAGDGRALPFRDGAFDIV